MPRALITGIRGQDGRYLAEFLHGKGYEIFGLVHDARTDDSRVAREMPFVNLVRGNLTDITSLVRACEEAQPDEIYNLGSQSAVDLSFTEPKATMDVTGLGPMNFLEALRIWNPGGDAKFYQASSSEMFGDAGTLPYSEQTQFRPRSPYAIAKVLAHHATRMYREAYGIYASTGICFNHESPRRGHNFVTRKISTAVARISLGLQAKLVLGRLDSRRDWGFAGDYVEAMWLTLQHSEPDDFIVATGESHSVEEFVELAFARVGIADWRNYVVQDERFFRPLDVMDLCGDNSKARTSLGWKPAIRFEELVNMMVDADIELAKTSTTSSSAT
ncbi:MAG TPA: GDP-mannose 4,6-dehydratase [Streptosporangiaceae bacterium]|nr:GDP-mannose 4,6-dehydratase [Streptosporangiaceae bacterium]